MTDTKPYLSRDEIESMAQWCEWVARQPKVSDALRALLDAKEAAERIILDHNAQRIADMAETKRAYEMAERNLHQLTEARASAAAAWEAGRDAAADRMEPQNPRDDWTQYAHDMHGHSNSIRALTNPDPSATEALRRVKEAVWEEGWASHGETSGSHTCHPNPYRQPKEAAE